LGVGECAGQVVSFVQFGLAAAERICFDAQLALEQGRHKGAAELAFRAMLEAAKALTRERARRTGASSPLSSEQSNLDEPETTRPSAGARSVGCTTRRTPGLTSRTEQSSS
jgi:hypothetical protein